MDGSNNYLVQSVDIVTSKDGGKTKEASKQVSFCPTKREASRTPLTREDAINLAAWLLSAAGATEVDIATMSYMVKIQRDLEKLSG